MAQMREANEHLIVAAVRAQTLTGEARRLKDELLAMVSHEIRTPLNAVLGWARMLESKQLPPERAEHAIAAFGRSAAALAHMIDDLLDTSRIIRGAVRLALRTVDLAAVAQEALDAVRPLAAASAREALHVLDVERHDALVSDIDLSDEDGYALIHQIRQHESEHGGSLSASP